MQIKVDYCPDHRALEITYDEDARKAFAAASQAVDQFCRDDAALTLVAQDPHFAIDRLIRGAEMLKLLATKLPAQSQVNAADIRMALNLTCFTALYRVDVGLPVDPLPEAIMLLARTVPFPVRKTALPPAVEVLDRDIDSSQIWMVYDLVQSEKETGPIFLPLALVHQLGHALNRLNFTNPEIDLLRRDIECMTSAFDFTMHSLAMVEWLASRDQDSQP